MQLPPVHHGTNDIWHVAVTHRLGEVPVGEVSVAVVVSAPHRGASLWAVQYIIDTLKARVPIWKREFFVGAPEGQWKSNAECGCGGGAEAPPLIPPLVPQAQQPGAGGGPAE